MLDFYDLAGTYVPRGKEVYALRYDGSLEHQKALLDHSSFFESNGDLIYWDGGLFKAARVLSEGDYVVEEDLDILVFTSQEFHASYKEA